jgi:hypothetical protein
MATILRHISGSSLEEVEGTIAALPRKVEIKSVNYAPLKNGGASQWVVCFCVDEWNAAPVVNKTKNIKKEK